MGQWLFTLLSMQSGEGAEVIIVGAGLSGLACARSLKRAGIPSLLLEASDKAGGRIRTDEVEGFLLDRGFQVILPSYPEAKEVLDYGRLRLRKFYRGADLMIQGERCRMADPFAHPIDALRRSLCKRTSWRDKWHTLLLKKEVLGLHDIPRDVPEIETEDYLKGFGFSDSFIDRFFRPFFGGVFLEKDLRTSSRVFEFIFAMFDQGGAAIPELGMQAIPKQLEEQLPEGSIRFNTRVAKLTDDGVQLQSGESLKGKQVVLAVDEMVASKLLEREKPLKPGRSVTCLYFATDQPMPKDPILFLDGDGRGPVNNAVVMSRVSPAYAPDGQHLISASVIGGTGGGELESVVREHLTEWFGLGVAQWRHLKTYTILDAQSEERQLSVGNQSVDPKLRPGLYCCGDYLHDVSINGALISGRHAAEAILRDLKA